MSVCDTTGFELKERCLRVAKIYLPDRRQQIIVSVCVWSD